MFFFFYYFQQNIPFKNNRPSLNVLTNLFNIPTIFIEKKNRFWNETLKSNNFSHPLIPNFLPLNTSILIIIFSK